MQDRVVADNPIADETEIPLGEINPAEWRVVVLEHVEADGTRHVIERGVPLEEIERDSTVAVSLRRDVSPDIDPYTEYVDENGYVIDSSDVAKILAAQQSTNEEATEPLTVGSMLFVDLPEHGISGDFTVTAILPCPTPNPGDGCLVTTKFIHENAEILDLRIEGSAEAIGTTASHPK